MSARYSLNFDQNTHSILTQWHAAITMLSTEVKLDFHKSNNSGSLSPIASAIIATNTSPITLNINSTDNNYFTSYNVIYSNTKITIPRSQKKYLQKI